MQHNFHTTPQFCTPDVPASWGDSRETHALVAMAIHAISDDDRSPEAIWEDPTPEEWDNVTMAVENYVSCGATPDSASRYSWGEEAIDLAPSNA